MGPTLVVLAFSGVAHAQGTMHFSGAQTLMETFKTFAIYAGAVICFGGLIFVGIRMLSGPFSRRHTWVTRCAVRRRTRMGRRLDRNCMSRLQQGSFLRLKRKTDPDLWVFRWYEEIDGTRTYRKNERSEQWFAFRIVRMQKR